MHDFFHFFSMKDDTSMSTPFLFLFTLSFTGAEMDVPARGWGVFFGCEAVFGGIQPQDDQSSFYAYKDYMII